MKKLSEFVMTALVRGMLFVVPVYLSILLLLKATKSVVALVRPLAMLFPEWFPAERLLYSSPRTRCLFPDRGSHPYLCRAITPGAN